MLPISIGDIVKSRLLKSIMACSQKSATGACLGEIYKNARNILTWNNPVYLAKVRLLLIFKEKMGLIVIFLDKVGVFELFLKRKKSLALVL